MVRRVRWVGGTICVAAVCVLASRPAGGAVVLPPQVSGQKRFTVEHETAINRTLRFTGAGERTLDVRTINGSIRVLASTDANVHVEARRRTRAESEADRLQADSEVTFDILENAGTVGAIVREPDGLTCGEPGSRRDRRRPRYSVTVDVTVRVPSGTRLRLCSINGGEVRVNQTAGDFAINNVNGPITMDAVRGSGTAHTVNGAVAISFTESPRAASSFKTLNGDVTVTFPPDFSADLALKTFNGGVFTDFDVEALPQRAAVPVERRNGKTVYRSNEFTRVRAGSGGPEITFETFNGDVRVLRAAR